MSGVELWERFSYYGMLTILGGLGLPQSTATGIVGTITLASSGWVSRRVADAH